MNMNAIFKHSIIITIMVANFYTLPTRTTCNTANNINNKCNDFVACCYKKLYRTQQKSRQTGFAQINYQNNPVQSHSTTKQLEDHQRHQCCPASICQQLSLWINQMNLHLVHNQLFQPQLLCNVCLIHYRLLQSHLCICQYSYSYIS